MKHLIAAALLLLLAPSVMAGVDIRPGNKYFKVRQGPQELATHTIEQACIDDARRRTSNPLTTPRIHYLVMSGGGAVLSTPTTREACEAGPTLLLTEQGLTRTDGSNVLSCVINVSFSTAFQPPTCRITLNTIGRYTTNPTTPPPVPQPPCTCPPPVVDPPASATLLEWKAPTQNTDGSALTNLAGYRVVYGATATELVRTVQITNPSIRQLDAKTIQGITPGRWHFAVKAYTSAGVESDTSNVVLLTVQ